MNKQEEKSCIRDSSEKRILVVGNGFDLYHNLPTKYIDFIDVINRLIELDKGQKGKAKHLSYLFCEDSPLYKNNCSIKNCFDTYKDRISSTKLNDNKIKEMVDIAKENIWFKYFNMCLKENIDWIDFEVEIRYIIESFESLFVQIRKRYNSESFIKDNCQLIEYNMLLNDAKYIAESFDFFKKTEKNNEEHTHITIDDSYALKRNTPSGIMIMGVDEKKIMDKLADELDSFSKLFELYITEIINKISVDDSMKNTEIFKNINGVISFNYTDTYKNIYDKYISDKDIKFIHGKAVAGNIVFGTNSDLHDESKKFNENHVKFKKEYRRLCNGNLLDYRKLFRNEKKINFIFFGHSLDKTDEDILKELIDLENAKCTIYYLDVKTKNDYIFNLYKFFDSEKTAKIVEEEKIEYRLISDYTV